MYGGSCMLMRKSIVRTNLLAIALVMSFVGSPAQAAALANESFKGISTPDGTWLSGGGGGSLACLTAAPSDASGSIPACSGGPVDADGAGYLRLTPTAQFRSGYAIYNTAIPAGQGLSVNFDMLQYGGNGADGIAFFLIDGDESPSAPGAFGGSLGYSSDSLDPGIVGGYVGVGFDSFGNFSGNDHGAGGIGRTENSIVIRGSEATNYQYVTGKVASGSLMGADRAGSKRQVRITISTSNIMTVSVNYGSGFVTELSNINLATINGASTMPSSFKFGFAASTGDQTNTHEIQGLVINTNQPNVSVDIAHTGAFNAGGNGQFTLTATNAADAENTAGSYSVAQTLPAGLIPTAASGAGWNCTINGQTVTCDRGDVLSAGTSAPVITVSAAVAKTAPASLVTTAAVTVTDNSNPDPTDSDTVAIDLSGVLGASAPATGLPAQSMFGFGLAALVSLVLIFLANRFRRSSETV